MNAKLLAEELQQHTDQFKQLILKFTPEQLNTIPFPGSWTAGQVGRHIIKSTDGLPDTNTSPPLRAPDKQVQVLQAIFLDFTAKFNAPEFVRPEPGPYDKSFIITELNRVKAQNYDIALTRDLSELCLDFEFPSVGYLTRFEWLKFFVFHTQRHIHQLNKIAETLMVIQVQ
jgi:hypothetical protein